MRLRARLLRISLDEASVARRRFRCDREETRRRLERIGETFLAGYHAALSASDAHVLARHLNGVPPEFRGFAFEGAAMAFALLDRLTPWNRHRWRAFTDGAGAVHVYMTHVGVGWALARLPRVGPAMARPPVRLDPLLGWLAFDGYGFHEGYFHWDRYVGTRHASAPLQGYARRAFDQGLGRSLWFVDGADVRRIPATIEALPPARHQDLWSGVGLACTYAGGADEAAIKVLSTAAGAHRSQLAQGAAFATTARIRAGNLVSHTAAACEILCGISPQTTAHLVDRACEELPADGSEPAYEVWRRRIQSHFAQRTTSAA